MGGILTGNNTTSWLHLASWNLPDSQKIQNGAEDDNTHVRYLRLKQQYSNWWGQTNTTRHLSDTFHTPSIQPPGIFLNPTDRFKTHP